MSTAEHTAKFLRDMADGVEKAGKGIAIIGIVLVNGEDMPEFWAPEADVKKIGEALMEMETIKITGVVLR